MYNISVIVVLNIFFAPHFVDYLGPDWLRDLLSPVYNIFVILVLNICFGLNFLDYSGIGATIRTRQEIQCLLYTGFILLFS